MTRPPDKELYDEYWLLRAQGHGIIGAQHKLVAQYPPLRFGPELDAITHPKKDAS